MPVTQLLGSPAEPSVRITGPADARTLWRGPSGGTGTIIAATTPPWAAELWRWILRPGESFGGDAHAPATREMSWVESGTLTLTVAGDRYEVGTGHCARFPGGVPHSYANEGDDQVVLTMITVIPPAPS